MLEPAMMNCGIVLPSAGFLEMVRELCTRHGTLLVFDEVKTGITVSAGGCTGESLDRQRLHNMHSTMSGG